MCIYRPVDINFEQGWYKLQMLFYKSCVSMLRRCLDAILLDCTCKADTYRILDLNVDDQHLDSLVIHITNATAGRMSARETTKPRRNPRRMPTAQILGPTTRTQPPTLQSLCPSEKPQKTILTRSSQTSA